MDREERSPCRLYLVSPAGLTGTAEVATFADRLAAALEAAEVACLLLRTEGLSGEAVARAAEAAVPLAHRHDVAVLLEGRPDLAAGVGADGSHLTGAGQHIAQVRRMIGPEAIVGAGCGRSRDLAIEAAEAGADYVAFGDLEDEEAPPLELLAWWQETTVLPCVALGRITPESAAETARAGADFLAVGQAVWDHPEGPAAALARFAEALASPRPG